MPMRRKVGAGLLLLALLGSAATVNLPFGSWSRASEGPIPSPHSFGWGSARLQRELEQGLDQVRRNRPGENGRQVLDVLAGKRRRQNRPDGLIVVYGLASLERGNRDTRAGKASRQV